MSFDDERNSLESRFNTQWATYATSANVPIAWDNVEYKPVTGTTFVRFSVFPGDSYQASLGDRPLHRAVGIIDIGIFVPQGEGTENARDLADIAAEIFRNWQDTTNKIRCRSPYLTRVGEEEGWFQMSVTIPYIRDELFDNP